MSVEIVAALIAVVAGVPGALWQQQRVERRQETEPVLQLIERIEDLLVEGRADTETITQIRTKVGRQVDSTAPAQLRPELRVVLVAMYKYESALQPLTVESEAEVRAGLRQTLDPVRAAVERYRRRLFTPRSY